MRKEPRYQKRDTKNRSHQKNDETITAGVDKVKLSRNIPSFEVTNRTKNRINSTQGASSSLQSPMWSPQQRKDLFGEYKPKALNIPCDNGHFVQVFSEDLKSPQANKEIKSTPQTTSKEQNMLLFDTETCISLQTLFENCKAKKQTQDHHKMEQEIYSVPAFPNRASAGCGIQQVVLALTPRPIMHGFPQFHVEIKYTWTQEFIHTEISSLLNQTRVGNVQVTKLFPRRQDKVLDTEVEPSKKKPCMSTVNQLSSRDTKSSFLQREREKPEGSYCHFDQLPESPGFVKSDSSQWVSVRQPPI